MRNFVLGDEKALLMALYPRGIRPPRPFPYFNEVMTGFEYTVSIGMFYEDQIDEGLRSIKNIRDRYDGLKRNPFDEAECGHHYARAMASWAGILAWTGQQYDDRNGVLEFSRISKTPTPWFVGDSWGTIREENEKMILEICDGTLILSSTKKGNLGVRLNKNDKETFKPQVLIF